MRRFRFTAVRATALGLISVSIAPMLPACTGPAHGGSDDSEPSADVSQSVRPMVLPGLQNVRALSPGVYCGSVPEGEAGFQSLQLLDVRSVISVDGARPDVGAARARGLSYAHIPIRYSGISDEAAVQLAAAVRDLPGPVYIHCHHGRHRGPAAACLALVELGVISPQRGVELLEAAGTSHDYPGLYAAVAQAGRIDDAALRGVAAELPAAAPVPGFVAAMSGIEVTFGHLRAVERAGWGPPEDHPDLVPAAEAGMLHDLFRAAQADTQVPSAQDDFARWLAQSIERSARLEEAIAAGDARQASAELATLSNLCTQCHVRYRD